MGQKVNPISVRLEQTNRHFDSCWYGDYQYSYLLNEDLKVKSYINNILKQMECPSSHISVIYMAKKIKILFCYLDPRHSTYLKSSRLYLKLVNKNNNKKKQRKRKRNFFKNQFVGRYLHIKHKKAVFSTQEQAYIKYNSRIPFVMKKNAVAEAGNLVDKNSTHHHINRHLKNYSLFKEREAMLGFTKLGEPSLGLAFKERQPNDKLLSNYNVGEIPVKLGLKKKSLIAAANNINADITYNAKRKSKTSSGDGPLQYLKYKKYKKKSLQLDNTVLPSYAAPYSALVTRKNPFRILLAFYRKKKKKKYKKTSSFAFKERAGVAVNSKKGWNTEKRRQSLKKKTGILSLGKKKSWRQAAFWRYLTKGSVLSMGGKNKNYDPFSAIWSYLFFNHKAFFNKVIQTKNGYQSWHKSLFIRYLLLFIYTKKLKFFASPINYYMGSPIFQLAAQPVKKINLSCLADKSYVKCNLKKVKQKNTNNRYIEKNIPFLKGRSLNKMGLNVNADKKRLAINNVNSNLLKYHVALESINRIEWLQGRSMAFLWFIFNSVHPKERVIKTKSVIPNICEKSFFLGRIKGLQSLLAASQKAKYNLNLYTYPYQITPSQTMVVNKIKNLQLSNKVPLSETRDNNLPISILTENANSFKIFTLPCIKEESMPYKTKVPFTVFSSKKEQTSRVNKKTFNNPFTVCSKAEQTVGFNKKHNYLKKNIKDKALRMPRKLLYPRTAKSKGFVSYIEYILSSQLKTNVRLFSWKTRDEKKSALFLVEQIVYFLQKRIPFSRIKQQICRELKLESMQGIRITYSGRLGGRSKKAQRSRQ